MGWRCGFGLAHSWLEMGKFDADRRYWIFKACKVCGKLRKGSMRTSGTIEDFNRQIDDSVDEKKISAMGDWVDKHIGEGETGGSGVVARIPDGKTGGSGALNQGRREGHSDRRPGVVHKRDADGSTHNRT